MLSLEVTVNVSGDAGGGQILACEHLAITLGGHRVIDDATFSIDSGQSVSVMGTTGSGKTSLLNAVMGFVRPLSGHLMVAGHDLIRASSRDILKLRRSTIGVVFQSGELLDELTPVENVLVAAILAGVDKVEATSRASELLDNFRVPARDSTAVLSGGEKQRVAIARALVTRPRLVVADEPTASLDTTTRDQVAEVLYSLPAQTGCGLLVVTHDPAVASTADAQYQLRDGRLQLKGTRW